MNFDDIDIRQVPVEQVLPLRTRVLRPNYDDGKWHRYHNDDHEQALHFAAFHTDDDQIVAVISYMPEPLSIDGESAELRLRGMAVHETMRRRGIGSHLLSATLTKVALHHPQHSRVWAAARTAAIEFYEQHGFRPVGDLFHIPDAGEHRRVVRDLPTVLAADAHS